ncbi:UDP-glucose dehydrogenase [Caenispirillum salinarum AK4]|uniref:UDP-glucose dehydrogenase n=1 Tax=Caenispirillum salinarum AK4 TaxID=1238182 RepID=K9HAT7_9PROT|nr:nucleotide sugar dehydrogenase [Caenispirillum salinarum]EKV25901.1 UDP-glucose dehydrogenase [Caenispirillum salinarum AK4]
MIVPETFADRNVCILGLGYVGLTLAAAMADVGFRVQGVEIRDDVVEMLRKGEPHFHEPGLVDVLARNIRGGRLTVTREIPENSGATVYIITVGTPLGPDGKVRMEMISNVASEVARHLKDGDMVIMRSTVRLGTTRQVVLPILDRIGVNYDVAFCPERTLEGVALQELRRLPQIIGGAVQRATIRASQLFQFLTPTTVRVSDLETAEMIKLVDNAQRDVQFAYANEVARVCDAIGVSASEVINAGKLSYPRTNLPMPGPVGGPCLEKDPHILAEGLKPYGIVPEITLTARRLNESQPREVVEHLGRVTAALEGFPARPVITLMGLAFKGCPATDDLRGTMARPILAALREVFPEAEWRGYDSVVPASEVGAFGLTPMSSIEDAMTGANLVVIANNHVDFSAMPLATIAERLARPALVYDFWNNFAARDLMMPEGTAYMALGSHGCAGLPATGAATLETANG